MSAVLGRVCSVCQEHKAAHEFAKSKATACGLANRCRPCNKQYMQEWRSRNPRAFAEWATNNKERRKNYGEAWRDANRERRAQYMSDWLRANKARVNARIAKRCAAKKMATPRWADFDAISKFYERAALLTKATGVKHEVDHIYPLQGALVCGLHCEANLQILTKAENIRKLNHMPEEVA